jgi:hypothetical protein
MTFWIGVASLRHVTDARDQLVSIAGSGAAEAFERGFHLSISAGTAAH